MALAGLNQLRMRGDVVVQGERYGTKCDAGRGSSQGEGGKGREVKIKKGRE